MRTKRMWGMGLTGVAATALALTAPAQERPAAQRQTEQPTQPAETRRGGEAGEVQITLRPSGDGRYEVFIDGNRVEGRVGERLMRALGDQRGEGLRRGAPGEGAAGDRPMRPGRSLQGDVPPGDRPPGPPGMDERLSEEMPPFRQRVGQYYDGPVPDLTDELLAEVMEVIKDFDEALYTRLSTAMQANPDVVRGRIQNDLRRWMGAVELKRNDPELYELNIKDRHFAHETSRLAGEFAAARRENDTAKMESTRGQLQELVGEHFDVRQKLRERDLAQLEQRLEFLRTQVQQRRERRAEIIAAHLEELLGGPTDDF